MLECPAVFDIDVLVKVRAILFYFICLSVCERRFVFLISLRKHGRKSKRGSDEPDSQSHPESKGH